MSFVLQRGGLSPARLLRVLRVPDADSALRRFLCKLLYHSSPPQPP